jgi:hypothetical protein
MRERRLHAVGEFEDEGVAMGSTVISALPLAYHVDPARHGGS